MHVDMVQLWLALGMQWDEVLCLSYLKNLGSECLFCEILCEGVERVTVCLVAWLYIAPDSKVISTIRTDR